MLKVSKQEGVKEVSEDVERELAWSRGILCPFKRKKKGVNHWLCMEPRKLRNVLCLPSWETGYSTVLTLQKIKEPWIGKLAGIYMKQQLKMSKKIP